MVYALPPQSTHFISYCDFDNPRFDPLQNRIIHQLNNKVFTFDLSYPDNQIKKPIEPFIII